MMPKVTFYHNSKCSKSRQSLALLDAQGIAPHIIEYLKNPPNASELKEILSKLKLTARDLLRKKEKEYTALCLNNPDLSESALIAAMVAHPILIERPIVICGDKARIGRPPEKVLEVLA